MDQYQHAVLRYDNLLLFGGDRRVPDGNAVPHAYSDMFSEIADAATQCGCTFTLYVDDIFKRFYRTDPAHHRNGNYGLGLAIAAGVAEQHGGKVWAESIAGINTFYLELKTV
ncbi:sensor histidine kinase [Gemmiger sp.]|uniref:sensor histidine kinase n=1 Tax=Gemmiger sp. TaxID=2049027 RepID=UPI0025C54914|nr:sensor histidine kinase [Gemmiger sp.]